MAVPSATAITWVGSGLAMLGGLIGHTFGTALAQAPGPMVDGATGVGFLGVVMAIGGLVTTWFQMYLKHVEGMMDKRIEAMKVDLAERDKIIDANQTRIHEMENTIHKLMEAAQCAEPHCPVFKTCLHADPKAPIRDHVNLQKLIEDRSQPPTQQAPQ